MADTQHGYPNCECDLEGGDPDCTIQPPWQSAAQKYMSIYEENKEMRSMLTEIRDAALFVDDDNVICFMEEVPVSLELYERICQIVRTK